jgi:nucleotidyltransferase/DNA polymerase involved in DNA repair
MGAPWFKIRHLEEEAGLVALSANFELYGDMSDRMMTLAADLGHNQEVYSIDESFVDLSGITLKAYKPSIFNLLLEGTSKSFDTLFWTWVRLVHEASNTSFRLHSQYSQPTTTSDRHPEHSFLLSKRHGFFSFPSSPRMPRDLEKQCTHSEF